MGPQQIQALAALLPVDAKLIGPLRGQGGGRRQHRALVDVHQLHRNTREIPQLLFFGIEALADLLAGELDEGGGVAGQIHHDHRVLVAGMPGERRHPACAPLPGGEHAGDVDQGLHGHHVDEGLHLVLVAQGKQVVKQLGLGLFHQPGHLYGGQHVRERIVGVGVGHPVGHRQPLQLEARLAFVVEGPLYPLRAQGVAGPQHVEDVPAGVAVLPAVGIGVIEVAIEGVAGHLVIEADAVVAQHAGVRGGELLVDLANEVRLAQAVLHRLLRRDAGDEAGFRLRQVIRGRFAVNHQWLADDVEVGVGANTRKLRRPVLGGADAEGLVIVEIEGRICLLAHFVVLNCVYMLEKQVVIRSVISDCLTLSDLDSVRFRPVWYVSVYTSGRVNVSVKNQMTSHRRVICHLLMRSYGHSMVSPTLARRNCQIVMDCQLGSPSVAPSHGSIAIAGKEKRRDSKLDAIPTLNSLMPGL
ncbi:hypothetical protein D3C76_900860 [compost metagenome]